TGKAKERLPVYTPTGVKAKRLLVLGLGKPDAHERGGLYESAAAAARQVTAKKHRRVALHVPNFSPNAPPAPAGGDPGLDLRTSVPALGAGLMQGSLGPGLFKAEPSRFAPDELMLIAPPGADHEVMDEAVRRARIDGLAVALARDLVNLPPSELYPETFAKKAAQVAEQLNINYSVWDEERMREERMGAILGVAQGSSRPPRMVILRYYPRPGEPILGLVGKGVTFDSGGLSLKNTEQMADMKGDMAGAAAVLAATQAVAELGLPVNVLAVLPLVENMPGGRAMKLGDVLHARNGKTIEVLNTDAEGRLVLADALAYAVEEQVSRVVDLATLTGACMVALGTEVAGLMANDEGWGEQVRRAAKRGGEKVWPLPMYEHYEELVQSKVADLKNAPETRYGGAIAAAKFLEQFVGGVPWAHLDIAGPAWAERETASLDPGGTGFGVRTLIELARSV
ncbi:MAG TPA: leucyl aminopeptidase, partial [Gemmataceae bacterium]